MREYSINDLRNISLIGHSGAGKTSLVESLLYSSKLIDRLGKIEEGTTFSDYDLEEKKRKISINTSISQMELERNKVSLLDTPGYFDFTGEVIKGIKGSDASLIVVCGVAGVQVGTEKAWNYCVKRNIPRAFFINKLDRENSNYDRVLNGLRNKFGNKIVPLNYPLGKEENFSKVLDTLLNKDCLYDIDEETLEKINMYREEIIELIAENDEELLEKYLEEGTLSEKEIHFGLIKGMACGDIIPVMCGSSTKCLGIDELIKYINGIFPSPNFTDEISNDNKEGFSAVVFKTIVGPFMGKLSIFKVITGELSTSMDILNFSLRKYSYHLFLAIEKSHVLILDSPLNLCNDFKAPKKVSDTKSSEREVSCAKLTRYLNTSCLYSSYIFFSNINLLS